MLFLPGASGDAAFWDPIRSLISDHVSTAAIGWPGLGDNPAQPDVASYEDLVSLVIDHLDSTRQPVTLVGQSMGGWVAARVAVTRPDLVSHLVLAVTSAGVDLESVGAIDWRPGARIARPDAPEWSYATHPSMEAELAELATPALLLWASDDPISPLAVGRRLDELLPTSELVVYDSDDHWVVLHHQADVATRIETFISS